MEIPIEKLRTLSPEVIVKLKNEGITTLEGFYEIAKHPDSREKLSQKIAVPPFTLEEWSSDAGNMILMMSMFRK